MVTLPWYTTSSPRRYLWLVPIVICLTALFLQVSPAHGKAKGKKSPQSKQHDPSRSKRGKSFFWLIDPRDNSCLGASGFVQCDSSTAWIVADRKEGKVLVSLLGSDGPEMCLERKWCHSAYSPVSVGSCKQCGAKHWKMKKP